MKRMVAVFLFAAGLALVGVALGLLYMDVRAFEALALAKQGAPGQVDVAAIKAWEDPKQVWSALWAGSIGAGLAGAGLLLAVFELPMFNKGSRPAGG